MTVSLGSCTKKKVLDTRPHRSRAHVRAHPSNVTHKGQRVSKRVSKKVSKRGREREEEREGQRERSAATQTPNSVTDRRSLQQRRSTHGKYWLEDRRAIRAMHERVQLCQDPQTESALLRESLGVSRINHILRVHGHTIPLRRGWTAIS